MAEGNVEHCLEIVFVFGFDVLVIVLQGFVIIFVFELFGAELFLGFLLC